MKTIDKFAIAGIVYCICNIVYTFSHAILVPTCRDPETTIDCIASMPMLFGWVWRATYGLVG